MPFKKRTLYILLFFLCFLPGVIIAQPKALLYKTFGEQFSFVDSVFNGIIDLDSSQAILRLDKLQKWAAGNNDGQLQYALELVKYRYLIIKKGKNNTEVERRLPELIEKVKGDKYKWLEAEAMGILADYDWNDYSKCGMGFDIALRAYDIYANASVSEFPPKATCLFKLGINHMRFKEYSGAKKYLIEAEESASGSADPGKYNILNAIGLCFRNLSAYDSAEFYFKKAYSYAVAADNTAWQGIISGNLGITYYLEGDFRQAIPLIEKDIINTKKPNVTTAKSMAILGDIYLIQGDKKKAMDLLRGSYQIIQKIRRWDDYEVMQILYLKLAKAYAANGNLQLAYTFMDSAMIARDSVASQKNILKLARVQQRQEHEKYESEVQKLADQKKLHAVIRNSLIGGILLLAIIALLFINGQRLKNNEREQKLIAEKQIAEAQKKLAETDLQNASQQLGDFTRNIQEKNELIEKFSAEIERLQSLPCSVELPDTRENLMKLQQSTILTEEQWENFRAIFDKVHTGFFIRLREKLPDLSPAEIRFTALSKLNLNNKEMAGILGISTDAVRMNRHRLKKKLNLQEEDSLEKLIDTI